MWVWACGAKRRCQEDGQSVAVSVLAVGAGGRGRVQRRWWRWWCIAVAVQDRGSRGSVLGCHSAGHNVYVPV